MYLGAGGAVTCGDAAGALAGGAGDAVLACELHVWKLGDVLHAVPAVEPVLVAIPSLRPPPGGSAAAPGGKHGAHGGGRAVRPAAEAEEQLLVTQRVLTLPLANEGSPS